MVVIRVKPAEMFENDKNLTWSFRPLLTWMRILGIDLFWFDQSPRNVLHSKLFSCYSFFLFLVNAGTALIFIIISDPLDWIVSNSLKMKSNFYADVVSSSIRLCGIHLSLLVLCWKQWGSILQLIKQIESELTFRPNTLVWLRKVLILGLIYTIVLVRPFSYPFNYIFFNNDE